MPGRRPLPTTLKQTRGTARKGRETGAEPSPELGAPSMPSELVGLAADAWDSLIVDLDRLGVLAVTDSMAIALAANARADCIELRALIQAEGRTYTATSASGASLVRPRPEVALLAAAEARLRHLLVEFGLTPSSRTRLATIDPRTPAVPAPVKPRKDTGGPEDFFYF